MDDYRFDGNYGIWNNMNSYLHFKKGFNYKKMENFYAIICPDYSLYGDMPRIMQIWNIYRSRAVGCYLSKMGFKVIPNIRWTDCKSYSYAFKGVEKGSIVSVGTLGCSKMIKDKIMFLNGFKK